MDFLDNNGYRSTTCVYIYIYNKDDGWWCIGVSVMIWWCLGGVSVMCWCKPCSVSVSIAQVRLHGVSARVCNVVFARFFSVLRWHLNGTLGGVWVVSCWWVPWRWWHGMLWARIIWVCISIKFQIDTHRHDTHQYTILNTLRTFSPWHLQRFFLSWPAEPR